MSIYMVFISTFECFCRHRGVFLCFHSQIEIDLFQNSILIYLEQYYRCTCVQCGLTPA